MAPSAVKPIHILSLDGAGVRGVNELIILQHVMNLLRDRLELSRTPKPCEYFDLIGGTALGGLTAVMLGRLEMSVDDALREYHAITSRIFSKENKKWIAMDGHFKSSGLETEIKRLLKERSEKETATLLQQGTVSGQTKGLVVLCATSKRQTELLRSYKSADDSFHDMKIWEAMRATCASGPLFKSFKHGNFNFINADSDCVNPIHQMLLEAERIFGPEAIIGSIVSIGAGGLDTNGFAAHPDSTKVIPSSIQSHLVSLAYETESTANKLPDELLLNEFVYFRLNVAYTPKYPPFADEWNHMGVTLSQAHDSLRRDEAQKHLALLLDALSGVDDERLTLTIGQITSYIVEFYSTPAPSYESKEERAKGLLKEASNFKWKKLREEGFPLIDEALQIYRELAVEDPLKYRPHLASTLRSYASDLVDCQRLTEAIVVRKEAVDVFEQLYADKPETYRQALAAILSTYASLLHNIGRSKEALEIGVRSIDLYRICAPQTAPLAEALANHSSQLSTLGYRAESISSIKEAIAIHQRLPISTAQQASLGTALSCLCFSLGTSERLEEAHAAIKEGLTHLEKVVGNQPTNINYQAQYAQALEVYSEIEMKLKHHDAAGQSIMQAIAIRRGLVQSSGNNHQFTLSIALSGLSSYQSLVCQNEAAVESAQENVAIRRNLAKDLPERYSSSLVHALCVLSIRLNAAQRDKEGLKVAEEAVELGRQLVKDNLPVHKTLYSDALTRLARHQNVLKMTEESLKNVLEALGIREKTEPGSQYHIQLLGTAQFLFCLNGRHEEALDVNEGYIRWKRKAFEKSPSTAVEGLAESLTHHSVCLRHVGRHDDAMAHQDEADSLLVAHSPAHDTERARLLELQAQSLTESRKFEEARTTYEKILTLRRQLLNETVISRDRLALTLHHAAVLLSDMELAAESLVYSQEHVKFMRGLGSEESDKYGPPLGRGLVLLGRALENIGRKEESLTILNEAESVLRKYSTFRIYLAMCLNNLGNRWTEGSTKSDHTRAVTVLEEAVLIFEDIVAAQPGLYENDLDRSKKDLLKAKSLVDSK